MIKQLSFFGIQTGIPIDKEMRFVNKQAIAISFIMVTISLIVSVHLWFKINTVENCCVDYIIKFSQNTLSSHNSKTPKGKDALIMDDGNELHKNTISNTTALFPLLIALTDY